MLRGKIVLWVVVLGAFAFLFAPRNVSAADQVVSNCVDDTELRNDLQAMQDGTGGTLSFNCGTTTIILTGGVLPTITKNTTIQGNDKITLSGNNGSPIFVSDATLTLNNITIRNGYNNGDDGGAIISNGTLNINSSKFLNNRADGWSGGAIIAFGAVNITNSEFANNKGANGGALYAKWSNAVVTITGSNFHDNETTSTTDGWGGAILVFDGASVTVNSTTFNLNQAREGGAVYITLNSKLTMNDNSTFTNNKANHGGGIYNEGTLNITNSTLNGNKATYSGGGILSFTTLILTNVTLNANEADDGGGINNPGTATLTNVTLSNNKAKDGGGISEFKGDVTAINTTFSGNSATSRGGGLLNDDSDARLTNVTFSGNSAPDGGGIYRHASGEFVKNTLFAKGANGDNCSGSFITSSFNLSDDNSCGFGTGWDNVPNLNLGPLANNGGFTQTHLPGIGSAAIDNGTGTSAPTNDQRGIARPQGAAVDIGAVERCANKPAKPVLVIPGNNKKTKGPQVALDWNDSLCTNKYNVVVRLGSTSGTKVFSKKNLASSAAITSALTKGQSYFWQVTALGDAGKTKSDWWKFTVK